jgi:hypothetical protein
LLPLLKQSLGEFGQIYGYQSLQSLTFEPQHWTAGVLVKLKELPFKVKIFKLFFTNEDIEWVITNDLSVSKNAFVVGLFAGR